MHAMTMSFYLVPIFVCLGFQSLLGFARSVHRVRDPHKPMVKTKWVDGNDQEYSLASYAWEESTLFKLFDYDHFINYLLPDGPLAIRKSSETVMGSELDKAITKCMDEIMKTKHSKKKFETFTSLKHDNFNFKKSTGLIIFRPKEKPFDRFVVKFYRETPRGLVRPFRKDYQQNCLFRMSGGISRYLVGFTRIKNLNYVKRRIAEHPRWSKRIETIRKFFWMPKDNRWFRVTGYSINGSAQQQIDLPSIYAVIGDFVEAEQTFSLYNEQDKETVMSLNDYLEGNIDPNISNYVYEGDGSQPKEDKKIKKMSKKEKDENKKRKKIVFLDTEHFPSSLGLRTRLQYDSYFTWYLRMFQKYMKDNFFRTRKDHLAIRDGKMTPIRACIE